MIPERALTAVLIGGVAAGCVLVLYPFFSALLWAAILVFTTWPLAEWFRVNLRLGHGGAAGLMVALTALVLMLPLALAAPSGASDVNHLKTVIQNALQGGLPDAPRWVLDIPVVGPSFVALWDRWAADITALGESLQPYFGILLEGGLNLLLGIAHGVLLFALALFVAFFFFFYGDHLSVRLRLLAHRIAGVHA
jgi:predicted PurR-regulated permease PerM